MTSLSNQLKRLRAPQTDEYSQAKYRESFLYDRKEASGIDCDTHFRIAQRGLENLIEHDESLAEFQDSLFSEASKLVERATLTDEENDQLSEEIRRYVDCTIAPFFTLSACHETFEYLIYKYKVHMYQMDDILAALLPYHETRLFARALLLFPKLRESHIWQWLRSYQDQGLPVPRSKIIAAMSSRSSSGLTGVLGDKLIEINKHSRHADRFTSFYTATTVGVIARNLDQPIIISQIMPHIMKSIKKCYNISLFLAGLTLVSYFAHMTPIEQDFLLQIADRLARSYLKLSERNDTNVQQKKTLRKAFALSMVTFCDNQNIEAADVSETLKRALVDVNLRQYERIVDCSSVYTKLASAFV